eukprot:c6657_g1_i1.p2 GENE.c6657_g1_i1~~c6657_g1_i1.p2  ORF type:complete len:127 (+),score=21.85 c6657_g1_i1:39-383(+)
MMKFLLLTVVVCVVVVHSEPIDEATTYLEIYSKNRTLSDPLEPTKAAANGEKDILGRACMNECGGLCRQLCAKFKALKVCNGCIRGCLTKCPTGAAPHHLTYDPYNLPETPSHH